MQTSDADLRAMLPGMLPRLWAFALRISGGRHDAADVVQLACVRALDRARQMHSDACPLSRMFSIVHSTWIDEVRPRNLRDGSGQDWDDNVLIAVTANGADKPKPEADLIDRQILTAVNGLPQRQREAMLLVAVERFNCKEAAAILRRPVGEVISHLSEARQTIGALHIRLDAGCLFRRGD